MMKYQWFWLLMSSFIIASLTACNQATLSSPTETPPETTPAGSADTPSATPTSTATPQPATASQVEGQPTETISARAMASQTPATRLTAIPLTSTQTIQGQKTPIGNPIPTPTDLGLQGLVKQAQEDLAQRLGIAITQIDLIELKFVTWPDKGFGCPRLGMVYPQVPQEGALIQLRVGTRTYDYHVGPGRPPFLCE
jgi:hypothetical protein